MKTSTKYIALFTLALSLTVTSCKKNKAEETAKVEKIVPENLKWSERMMLSEMERFPKPSLLDFRTSPKWSYTPGLVLSAFAKVYEKTNHKKYFDYIYAYADELIDSTGSIATYKLEKQNLDMIKSGDVLLYLYPKTKEERFLKAMQTLNSQMESQPKTSDGGYWHKEIYPHQMWLDGLYMAEPFHAQYARDFIKDEAEKQKIYNDVVLQFDLIQKHSRDEKSGLLYHGWDESKEQRWANKETGNSQHFWSRGMGWYGMAMVDVLDFLPENHPGRAHIIKYLNQFAEAIIKVQDESGLWWQVLDQGNREGNYLEATGTTMFTYTFAKGVRKGYLDKKYLEVAEKAYAGLLENLITVEENGVVNLNKCCGVAGLGGKPYRDGSYEYYINEMIRSNDPKGTGPFILASLELNK
ncbi:glycosyl hydrolase family 88 [Algibacter amylolyticus]|uniref:Glycosyl hydrolase family 88 n=1 Tax=Algibacter amylolyticus TaxID=1608400 RepID=A0A5M7BI94_9FLAO|nr:glycoside hydrolase family 88 protein [Algibacter amylolyticus]KAA5827988.1 glycosyl hydrolase family 88 [Algibacter amylolyticus]MBB5267228.1 unsaturated rhamnogalacturonyl hydrolase [Algibacter amylolyticus]TSJ82233.1 glycosyl hydrolase family 88 [Algibacter amylolyticus]